MKNIAAVAVVLVVVLASSACGGAVGFLFDPIQKTGSAGTVTAFDGTFKTEGTFGGKYTITSSDQGGIDSCLFSAGGNTKAATQTVDTSANASVAISLDVKVAANPGNDEVQCDLAAVSVDDSTRTTGAALSVKLTP